MEESYEKSYVASLKKKTKTPNCRFCGANSYYSIDSRITLFTEDVGLGGRRKVIPAGALICKQCGHIEFFALGILDEKLLNPNSQVTSPVDGEDERAQE